MLYPKNKEKTLDKKLFENPTSEYRGTPFWAWNCKVTKEQIDFQTEVFKQMGMGGAHIHCRTGMNIPYMSEEFLDQVAYAHDKFAEKEMLTWLYDEDRWPSGYGGGYVTKNSEYRMRFLVFSPEPIPDGVPKNRGRDVSAAVVIRSDSRRLLKRYGVRLNKAGTIEAYCVLEEGETLPEGYDPWYAYLEISGDNIWFNNQAYVNTLDKKAITRFLEVTHEQYEKKLGGFFGRDIPSIFTDEPQFVHKTRLGRVHDRKVQFLPYTDDFEESYEKVYGETFLEHLPEVFWEMEKKSVYKTRYQYHDHIAERFAEAYADQIGEWCEKHRIALTGHMMEEPTLKSQTAALGEAMRSYRSFHIPGIDMLCDWRELTTAKQAQSAVHQYGREGMVSEIYGVTDWDFDFRRHKLAGDWQAALGVTVRVHHLTWVSMEGEAKRDYPACIGYQSSWYQEYKMIEDYFSRLNTALTRGKPVVRVGVIHPIESYWLKWGSEETTGADREEMEVSFDNLVKWLLYGTIDFDFISESLLEQLEQMPKKGNGFVVGEMCYDVILVPNCLTLRNNTLKCLKQFVKNGGQVIFAGRIPTYVAAEKSREPVKMAEECIQIPFTKQTILDVLDSYRTLNIRDSSGIRSSNLLYQMRQDGENRWLFIAHSEKPESLDTIREEIWTVSTFGIWTVEQWDALDGTSMEIPVEYNEEEKKTEWVISSYAFDSHLYYLKPIKSNIQKIRKKEIQKQLVKIPETAAVILEEPNVFVLDMAESKLDNGEWREKEEILRLDNIFRRELGYPKRGDAYAQPWIYGERKYEHQISLRYSITSELEAEEVKLALENVQITNIIWNGQKVEHKICGYYVDQQIKMVILSYLKKGNNILEIQIPYHAGVDVEAMYLLGDFGVSVKGRQAFLTNPITKLAFGDICTQGLPFYGGNLIYYLPIETREDGILTVQVPQFRSPIIEVTLDGKCSKKLFKSPYKVTFEGVEKGLHNLELKMFGNRKNTFGQLHNCSGSELWCGPDAWRSTGENWAYEYQLTKTGILISPSVTLER